MADLLLILILGLFVVVGYKKGFVKMMISMLANIISIVLGAMFAGPLATLIYNSPIGSMISAGAESTIAEKADIGVKAVESVVADSVAFVASSVISFILITIAVRVIIGVVANAVNLVAKFPIIKQANSALGAIIGVASGIVICYAVLGVVNALYSANIIDYSYIIGSIEDSFICSLLYDGNLVTSNLSSIL